MNKFCVYCQEVTLHYVNEYAVLECCNCAPMRRIQIAALETQLMFQIAVIVILRVL